MKIVGPRVNEVKCERKEKEERLEQIMAKCISLMTVEKVRKTLGSSNDRLSSWS